MAFDLQQALHAVVDKGGSDLHLKVPSRPLMRLQGKLSPLGDTDPLTPADTERVLREMLTASDRLAEFARDGEIDFSYTVRGLARFRVNAFRQRGSISIACRVVPFTIRSVGELGLPEAVSRLADEPRRIIDFFPPHHHQQVRAMLAGSLRGVISQRLVPTVDGEGRVAACEVLTMTGRVRDMIADPNETAKLGEVIAEGTYYGMQTFDQALLNLYRDGRVSMDEALKAATHPHDFKLLVASEGQRSTSVDQIYSGNESVNQPPPDSNGGGNGMGG